MSGTVRSVRFEGLNDVLEKLKSERGRIRRKEIGRLQVCFALSWQPCVVMIWSVAASKIWFLCFSFLYHIQRTRRKMRSERKAERARKREEEFQDFLDNLSRWDKHEEICWTGTLITHLCYSGCFLSDVHIWWKSNLELIGWITYTRS